jgi:hypothetical protein
MYSYTYSSFGYIWIKVKDVLFEELHLERTSLNNYRNGKRFDQKLQR